MAGDYRERLFLDVAVLLVGVEVTRVGVLAADGAEGSFVRDLVPPVGEQDLEGGAALLGGALAVVFTAGIAGLPRSGDATIPASPSAALPRTAG